MTTKPFSPDLWQAGWVPVTTEGDNVADLAKVGKWLVGTRYSGLKLFYWNHDGTSTFYGGIDLLLQEPETTEYIVKYKPDQICRGDTNALRVEKDIPRTNMEIEYIIRVVRQGVEVVRAEVVGLLKKQL